MQSFVLVREPLFYVTGALWRKHTARRCSNNRRTENTEREDIKGEVKQREMKPVAQALNKTTNKFGYTRMCSFMVKLAQTLHESISHAFGTS